MLNFPAGSADRFGTTGLGLHCSSIESRGSSNPHAPSHSEGTICIISSLRLIQSYSCIQPPHSIFLGCRSAFRWGATLARLMWRHSLHRCSPHIRALALYLLRGVSIVASPLLFPAGTLAPQRCFRFTPPASAGKCHLLLHCDRRRCCSFRTAGSECYCKCFQPSAFACSRENATRNSWQANSRLC